MVILLRMRRNKDSVVDHSIQIHVRVRTFVQPRKVMCFVVAYSCSKKQYVHVQVYGRVLHARILQQYMETDACVCMIQTVWYTGV